jgi:hypothetical protein
MTTTKLQNMEGNNLPKSIKLNDALVKGDIISEYLKRYLYTPFEVTTNQEPYSNIPQYWYNSTYLR